MKKGKRDVPEDTILNKHIASITEAIYACKREMVAELESHQQIDLLLNLELPLARILSEMEETGIYTDINDLRQMQSEIQGKLDLLISNIHEAAGKNLTLTLKQLGVVLFETLELPVIKKQNWIFYCS